MYSKFKLCVDNLVDIKLCICVNEEIVSVIKSGEVIVNGVLCIMFGLEMIVKDLDLGCFLFLRWNYVKVVFVLEVINVCNDCIYKFELFGLFGERVYFNMLFIKFDLVLKIFYFLILVNRYIIKDSFFLFFEVSV